MLYVHGYGDEEAARLRDQADALTDLLHHDTAYPAGATVLEAGCGVGAQTVTLARNSPDAAITSIDISPASLAQARRFAAEAGVQNVTFAAADIYHLPFAAESFDHVFACFVLEHLRDPDRALAALGRVLKPGGTITAIEGDHGSAYFHPDSDAARRAIRCLIELQRYAGGNAEIGRALFPMLTDAGFRDVCVSPRMVYVDGNTPPLAEIFTKRTFTAMIEGVRAPAIDAGMIEAQDFDRGIVALNRAAEPDGVFCYTFFKAVAVR
ncbi:MAG TPA: methyltransferase domain-containing protein [Candidatus Baltobacteraceae bacterium]|jgi:SAM-dependent methyltransferase|nr:methyltransferase domain-containing protein [Candidatus Baltobacteraceae bacterium]